MKWFKHDSDAHRDAKMRRLMHKWGLEGYGLYWYCLEQIACEVGTSNLTFELEHDAEIIAHDVRMSREKVEDMMRYMVEVGLFEESDGVVTCMKLFKRIDLSQGGSKAFRDAVTAKRKEVLLGHSHDSVMTQSCIEVDIEVDVEDRSNKNTMSSVGTDNRVPASEIVSLYHEILPELPKCKKLTDARRAAIRQRWISGDLPSIENWRNFFEYVRDSDFLMGKTDPGPNRTRPFVADLEWLCKQSNFAKVYEEKYHGVRH